MTASHKLLKHLIEILFVFVTLFIGTSNAVAAEKKYFPNNSQVTVTAFVADTGEFYSHTVSSTKSLILIEKNTPYSEIFSNQWVSFRRIIAEIIYFKIDTLNAAKKNATQYSSLDEFSHHSLTQPSSTSIAWP